MARQRTKPYNPFIQSLLDKHGLVYLKDLLKVYPGLRYSTLQQYAEVQGSHQTLEAILRDAQALGMTTDEFITKLLGRTPSIYTKDSA